MIPIEITKAGTLLKAVNVSESFEQAFLKLLRRAFPPENMRVKDLADFLGCSESHVRSSVACKPDFPKPLKGIDSWSRDEVRAWQRGQL